MPRGTKTEPSDFTVAVQQELKRLQELKGWSQRELEHRSGIGQTRIARTIGTNAKSLDLTELDQICKALGVSPDIVIATAERNLIKRSAFDLAAKRSPNKKGMDYDDTV